MRDSRQKAIAMEALLEEERTPEPVSEPARAFHRGDGQRLPTVGCILCR